MSVAIILTLKVQDKSSIYLNCLESKLGENRNIINQKFNLRNPSTRFELYTKTYIKFKKHSNLQSRGNSKHRINIR